MGDANFIAALQKTVSYRAFVHHMFETARSPFPALTHARR